MKKTFEWLKAHWRILIGIALWAAIVALVFFIGDMSLSDRIQATSVITLAFITWFYAVQTQRLVKEQKDALEEERKKRNAEFGVERIKIFLRPLLKKLEDLNDSLSVITESRNRPLIDCWGNSLERFHVKLNNIDELFSEYLYMASVRLRGDLQKFLSEVKESIPTFENQAESYTIPWKKRIERKIQDLKNSIVFEASLISQQIRKTYGFFSHETEVLESSDDLTVLSDRPPRRI